MNSLDVVRQPVAHELKCYKEYFDNALAHEDDYLGSALAYIKSRSGKMMRPLLVLLVAKEVGEVGRNAYLSAVTLELLHTASLVHDDVVDESNERRGMSSVNHTYGNKMAVLLGDYLLSKSLHQSALTGDVNCVDVIARLGGTLSEGEIFQLANIRNAIASEEAYYGVIRKKTAELFAACGRLGAICQGADEKLVEAAQEFGLQVGMCFQIRDDIFDYYPSRLIGKPTGNDMREGKLTLPSLYALSACPDAAMHDIAARIQTGEVSVEEIERFMEWVRGNGGIEYARKKIEEFRQRALQALESFHRPEIKDALVNYLDYVVGRDK